MLLSDNSQFRIHDFICEAIIRFTCVYTCVRSTVFSSRSERDHEYDLTMTSKNHTIPWLCLYYNWRNVNNLSIRIYYTLEQKLQWRVAVRWNTVLKCPASFAMFNTLIYIYYLYLYIWIEFFSLLYQVLSWHTWGSCTPINLKILMPCQTVFNSLSGK